MSAAIVLRCDREKDCTAPIAYIDEKGYIYCTAHGVMRRMYRRCRKLTAPELQRLQAGEPLTKY